MQQVLPEDADIFNVVNEVIGKRMAGGPIPGGHSSVNSQIPIIIPGRHQEYLSGMQAAGQPMPSAAKKSDSGYSGIPMKKPQGRTDLVSDKFTRDPFVDQLIQSIVSAEGAPRPAPAQPLTREDQDVLNAVYGSGAPAGNYEVSGPQRR